MAAWQVEFFLIPKRMLAGVPSPVPVSMLGTLAWWAGGELPPDYRARLAATATPAHAAGHDVEIFGPQDANYIEVSKDAGKPIRIRACVDVRQPDAKFAAGLITFARAAGAALVRADGSVIEPTAGGFGLALRESAAWRYVQDHRLGSSEADIGRGDSD